MAVGGEGDRVVFDSRGRCHGALQVWNMLVVPEQTGRRVVPGQKGPAGGVWSKEPMYT